MPPTFLVRALVASCLFGLAAGAEEADQAEIAKGSNAFAFDLYGKLRARDGNLFFSPFSVSSALSMTWAGARENTEAQMAKTLHIGLPQERFHKAAGALLKELNARVMEGSWKNDPDKGQKGFELVVANALWGQVAYPFREEFVEQVSKTWDAGVKGLDFRADTEAARKTINSWVEEKTAKQIADLIPQGGLSADARLVLTNAIYFKARWEMTFKKAKTVEEDFRTAKGSTVKVPMMHATDYRRYYDEGTFEMVELMYQEALARMVVFVPKEHGGLEAMEAKLKATDVEAWVGKLKLTHIDFGFPRFRTTSTFELNSELAALGMKDAFNPSAADLSGISATKELFIGSVIHKAFVSVDENGTEAAAATLVAVYGAGKMKEPLKLQVDRPFVYLIRDEKSGAILFMGRVADPSAGR